MKLTLQWPTPVILHLLDPWDGEIGYKSRDGALIEGELDNPDIWAGASANDFVQNDMMRQDRVLMDFGGGKNYNTVCKL